MKNKLYSVLFYCWLLLLFTLTSIPKLSHPSSSIIGIDKIAHFFLYFVLALLYVLKNNKLSASKQKKHLLRMAVFLPLLDEIHQIPIPGRTFSWFDILADVCGIGLVILYVMLSKKLSDETKENQTFTRFSDITN